MVRPLTYAGRFGAWSILVVGLAGCWDPDTGGVDSTTPVSQMVLLPAGGTVTVKGKPLAGAVVTFLPPHGPAVGVGDTDEQGRYTLSCMGREGIPAGEYKVAVSYLVSDRGVPQSLGARSSQAQGPGMLSATEQFPPEYLGPRSDQAGRRGDAPGGSFDFDIPVDLAIPEKKPAEGKGADDEAAAAKTGRRTTRRRPRSGSRRRRPRGRRTRSRRRDDRLAGIRCRRGSRARLGPLDVLVLSAWCGLAAGWLEVGTRVLCRAIHPDRPAVPDEPALRLAGPAGEPAAVLRDGTAPGGGHEAVAPARRLARPASPSAPSASCRRFLIAGPQIYGWAWLILASGIAIRLVPWLERSWPAARRWLIRSLPRLLGLVPIVAGLVFGGDWFAQWREVRSSLAPGRFAQRAADRARHGAGGSPEPLWLSPGHQPDPGALARRGIRFDEARATAPWTLPSHASMFTGRWPHELAVEWVTPLRRPVPHAGRVPRIARLCDRGLRRQYRVLLVRHGPGPRLHPLRGLRPRSPSTFARCGRPCSSSRPGTGLPPGALADPEHARGTIPPAWLKWLTAPSERMPRRSIANSWTGCPAGRSRGVPSSPSSITSMPIRPTSPRKGPGSASASRPRTVADFILLVELCKTIDKLTAGPALSRAGARLLRQLPRLSGRATGRAVRRPATPRRARSNRW